MRIEKSMRGEVKNGSANKFYEMVIVKVGGIFLLLRRWGRIGAMGTMKVSEFESRQQCEAEVAKIGGEKMEYNFASVGRPADVDIDHLDNFYSGASGWEGIKTMITKYESAAKKANPATKAEHQSKHAMWGVWA